MALEPHSTAPPNVMGDFVVACHPRAAEWLDGLAAQGFRRVPGSGETLAAVRGAARHGGDGAPWVALADLVEGDLAEGGRSLDADVQARWRGRFARVSWQPGERRLSAVTDHFSTLSLYSLEHEGGLLLATDLRLLAASPWCPRSLDLEAIYHYLNFACIPAPRTIFRGIARLEPGTRLDWRDGGVTRTRWFVPEYREDLREPIDALARELRARMVATVERYRPPEASRWGCFMSGGTDSSSIVAILARQDPARRVRSFSIGFEESGFDELGFARLAAETAGSEWHFERVSRAQAQDSVPRLIAAYDQPFGNASAIPTMACAELARREGTEVLVAGDGGDEIFGGNERYAKNQVMEAFFALPAPVKAIGRVVGDAMGGTHVHLLNRFQNFVQRASLPNPERFYTDDSFASDYYDELLHPDFRREVARGASLELMRERYQQGTTGGPLHRIMRLDLLMAIAQNDLRKVDGAARAAGVSVRFPYLDPELVVFAGRLPERMKVRGLTKRYLFKRAARDFLPARILHKKKQGFGLPIAVWLRSDRRFRDMVADVLNDPRARARGWAEAGCVERLLDEHQRGSWDHADYLWRLFVLELWLRRHLDAA